MSLDLLSKKNNINKNNLMVGINCKLNSCGI